MQYHILQVTGLRQPPDHNADRDARDCGATQVLVPAAVGISVRRERVLLRFSTRSLRIGTESILEGEDMDLG